jgi:hypothetical protein
MSTGIFGLHLVALIQAIPVSLSLAANIGALSLIGYELSKYRQDSRTLLIIRHTALLVLTWMAFSIIWGLGKTFYLLESSNGTSFFTGFLYGFRIAMVWMLGGVTVFCVPLVIYLKRAR